MRAPLPILHGAGNSVTPRILGSRPVRLPAARALRASEARPSHPSVARNASDDDRRPGRYALVNETRMDMVYDPLTRVLPRGPFRAISPSRRAPVRCRNRCRLNEERARAS
jgi:hypothetical protein